MSGLVETTESSLMLKTTGINGKKKVFNMKKYCKDVDITNRTFVEKCIWERLIGKRASGKQCGENIITRPDAVELFAKTAHKSKKEIYEIVYQEKDQAVKDLKPIVDEIVNDIQGHVILEDWTWKPIWYTTKREGAKERTIAIQDITMQFYDYIAVNGLKSLFDAKIGYYQCAAIPGKGQLFCMKAIKKKIDSGNARYAWKADARHYYENINTEKLKELLKQYVKNDKLLKLVFSLIDSYKKGLGIGSFLCQFLANFYMSFAYHFAENKLFRKRKCKNGTNKQVRLIHGQFYYMDDILFIASSKKNLKIAVKKFVEWIEYELGIHLKPNYEWINLLDGYIDMVGFLISKKKVIIRQRIFQRHRRMVKKVRKLKTITLKRARSIVSRHGYVKHSNTQKWSKRNKEKQIFIISKEVVSNDQDVIHFATTKGNYCVVA